ncbi:MAG: hypothetical protein R3B06_01040 [Kofleriaceae bacterium]
MITIDLAAMGAFYAAQGISAEVRDGGLWIANPAAPAFGVRVQEAADQVAWTLEIPRPVPAAQTAEVAAALAHINPDAAPGAWSLSPASHTVSYQVAVPAARVELTPAGLLGPLVNVIEQGNTYVHALVEIIDGREPAGYVASVG